MNNQEKRKLFEEHLKQQDRQRQQQLERKKIAENNKNNPQEDMLFIQKEFRTLSQRMDALFDSLKKKEATLDDLTSHYSTMKNYYLQVNYALTTYDRQFYKEALEKIHNNILEMKRKLEPKKKFQFSRRKEDFGVKQVEETETVKQTHIKQNTIPGIENKDSQTITVTHECPPEGSFKIINCKNTHIELLQKTEILFLKDLSNCTVKAALTKSTVFVDNCTNCHLEINCHQLRIHNTYDTTLSIFVTSKAIIEFCDRVVFRPYAFQYAEKQQHEIDYERVGRVNLWRDIQDFGWLKQNEKSPHFTLAE